MGEKSRTPGRTGNKSQCVLPVLACALSLMSLSNGTLIRAQAATPATQPPAATTLHVYTNLKQVPVLVLTANYERMKPVDTSKFRLSLDSGPLFRPTYVRPEGEDPISLAILIDASKPDNKLLPQLSKAIAELSPEYLHTQDHLSIYVLDCTLIRTAYDVPADAAMLKQSVDSALAPWQIRQKLKQGFLAPCKPSMPLWDSINNVMDDLTQQSGRHVLLAITDGEDEGSKTLWTHVLHRAQIESVAIFGLLQMPITGMQRRKETGGFSKIAASYLLTSEDKFNQVCDLTGGVEIQQRNAIVSWRLKEFTKMIRERYIMEFPRGRDEEAGIHTLTVSYRKKDNLYIVSAGISVPIASDDEKNGANTIPDGPSRAPADGHRRKLTPKL
jgi:hypothetical protein